MKHSLGKPAPQPHVKDMPPPEGSIGKRKQRNCTHEERAWVVATFNQKRARFDSFKSTYTEIVRLWDARLPGRECPNRSTLHGWRDEGKAAEILSVHNATRGTAKGASSHVNQGRRQGLGARNEHAHPLLCHICGKGGVSAQCMVPQCRAACHVACFPCAVRGLVQ